MDPDLKLHLMAKTKTHARGTTRQKDRSAIAGDKTPKRGMLSGFLKRAVGKVFGRHSEDVPVVRPQRPNVRPIAPTKSETALMKPFEGLSLEHIHLPGTQAEFKKAAREIIAAGVVGFDTESKPVFNAGQKNHGPQVVQFALRDKAFIFQLHRRECWSFVSDLLESEQVLKVGFGLKNDRGQIRSKLGVNLQATLDLDQVFRKRGYSGQIGVRAAVGAVLNQSFPKSKSVTTSNWAAPDLTSKQLLYAANDAFAALRVMEALGLGRSAR